MPHECLLSLPLRGEMVTAVVEVVGAALVPPLLLLRLGNISRDTDDARLSIMRDKTAAETRGGD